VLKRLIYCSQFSTDFLVIFIFDLILHLLHFSFDSFFYLETINTVICKYDNAVKKKARTYKC
jgi:hypothetical protein